MTIALLFLPALPLARLALGRSLRLSEEGGCALDFVNAL